MSRILIACEFSGRVRDAFRALGHDAVSCDFKPSETLGPHHQGDVRDILRADRWDALIAFPDCTYLCSSGLHWNTRRPERAQLTEDALAFVRYLLDAPIPHIALENPVGCISTRIRRPDQTIQPWMFGEDASKATCLWLKGLPKLVPTTSMQRPVWVPCPDQCDDWVCQRHGLHTADCACPPLDDWVTRGDDPYYKYYANQTPSGQNKLGPSPTRAADRSRTYQGIASAMAATWGPLL